MSWEEIVTLAVVALTVLLLAKEWTSPAAAVLGGTITLLVVGVIEADAAFSGFSNPAPITVAALYVIAGAVDRTGVLAPVVSRVVGGASDERVRLARVAIPTAGVSGFLNNTPIVAMLVPPIIRWADRGGGSASRLLMPISYAAILGGMVTVIGTSTNLVVSGLLHESGLEPLGFFEVGKVGLFAAGAGLVLLIALAPQLLPDRRGARRDLEGDVREFVVEMVVVADGPLEGQTISSAGLRHLEGLFLVGLQRDEVIVTPVAPDTHLRGEDRLRFVGRASEVTDLSGVPGLVPAVDEHMRFETDRLSYFEAVIGPSSPLLGRSLKEIGFRDEFQAAVVAIHRADQRVRGKLGDVRLKVGDTLLLVSSGEFRMRWHGRNEFLLVSRLGGVEPSRSNKGPLAGLVAVGVVVAAATGMVDILEASLVGAVAVVLLGILTPSEARAAIDIDVLVMIAAAFGLGEAVRQSGLAQRLADAIVDGLGEVGPTAVLLGVVLATVLLTELITNNAAAILLFPIALTTAVSVGADPRGFAVAVALGASASFLTPIGYQTNTMVWGPGGYRYSDYARLGLPITTAVITVIVAVTGIVFEV